MSVISYQFSWILGNATLFAGKDLRFFTPLRCVQNDIVEGGCVQNDVVEGGRVQNDDEKPLPSGPFAPILAFPRRGGRDLCWLTAAAIVAEGAVAPF